MQKYSNGYITQERIQKMETQKFELIFSYLTITCVHHLVLKKSARLITRHIHKEHKHIIHEKLSGHSNKMKHEIITSIG